jgi:hypothetical protein
MPAANTYKVPKRQWAKWDETARRVFNGLHGVMLENKNLFLHPGQDAPRDEYWQTTCWNAAWEAADAANQK